MRNKMEVSNEIVENLFLDFQKKDINKFMRGEIIKKYILENELSGRQFAKNFNIPKSTIEDWLLWTKISKEQYNTLKESGLTHTEIYRTLRDNKDKDVQELIRDNEAKDVHSLLLESEFDLTLYKFINKCEKCLEAYPPNTKKTNVLLDKVKELLLNIESHYKSTDL